MHIFGSCQLHLGPQYAGFPLVFSFDNTHSIAPRPRPIDCHPFKGTLNPCFLLNWGPFLLCMSSWPSEAAGHASPQPTVLSCAAQPALECRVPCMALPKRPGSWLEGRSRRAQDLALIPSEFLALWNSGLWLYSITACCLCPSTPQRFCSQSVLCAALAQIFLGLWLNSLKF